MKKTIFALYALGALVVSPILTSCVDDTESQSVTDVREAKAEQLKGLAALANAQAQAETIKANAEASLKEAQAEYQKALAEQANAEAEAKAAETQRANEAYATSLEQAKADAEYQTAYYQYQLEQLKNQVTDYENSRIQTLSNNYLNALSQIADINQDIVSAKLTLAQVDANVEYAQAAYDYFVEQTTNKINKLSAQNAVLEANKDKDKDEIYAEYLASIPAEKEALDAKAAAEDTLNAAKAAVEESEYAQAVATLEGEGYDVSTKNDIVDSKATANSALTSAKASKTSAEANLKTENEALKTAQDALAAENKKETPDPTTVASLTANVTTAEKNVNDAADAVAAAQKDIDSANEILALLDVVTEGSDAQKVYAALEEAQEAAQDAYDKANKAYTEADALVTALSQLYNDAVNADETIASNNKDIAELQKEVETYSVNGYWDIDHSDYFSNSYVSGTDSNGNDINSYNYYYNYYFYWHEGASADADALTAAAEAKISQLEEKLAVWTALAEQYKAQLDALLAE